jgi:hypothetical protein
MPRTGRPKRAVGDGETKKRETLARGNRDAADIGGEASQEAWARRQRPREREREREREDLEADSHKPTHDSRPSLLLCLRIQNYL